MIVPQSFIHNSKILNGLKMFCSASILYQWKKLTLFTIRLPFVFLYCDGGVFIPFAEELYVLDDGVLLRFCEDY